VFFPFDGKWPGQIPDLGLAVLRLKVSCLLVQKSALTQLASCDYWEFAVVCMTTKSDEKHCTHVIYVLSEITVRT